MTTTDVGHPHPHAWGYRHEALFYADSDGFMAGTLPFLREAVAQGEPTLAVLAAPKIRALSDALGADADAVMFADMATVGTNPARIIPAWQEFLDEHGGTGRRVRGIGEPIWADRSPAELAECQRHEALLNVCFSEPGDFWLLCPYDTTALGEDVVEEARRNHPFVCHHGARDHSSSYPGHDAHTAPFETPLPAPPLGAAVIHFDVLSLRAVRALVEQQAMRARFDRRDVEDVVFVAHELAANSVRHGGGEGTLLVWQDDGALVWELRDRGRIDDPLVGRVRPAALSDGGRGVWLANQLCELVQIRSGEAGTVVRVHKRLAEALVTA